MINFIKNKILFFTESHAIMDIFNSIKTIDHFLSLSKRFLRLFKYLFSHRSTSFYVTLKTPVKKYNNKK